MDERAKQKTPLIRRTLTKTNLITPIIQRLCGRGKGGNKMNYYVKRYKQRRMEGFNPLEAFGVVAAGIAAHGTMEDLRVVENIRWKDSAGLLDEMKEDNDERIAKAI